MSTETTETIVGDLDGALAELSSYPSTFPEQALRTVQAHRDAAIPRLIDAIEQATATVASGDEALTDLPFFGLLLLAEFRAKEAWPAILKALALPGDEAPFELFGDVITGQLPSIIADYCADSIETIDALVANPSLNEFVRWSAAGAYLRLVRDGRLSREAAVQRLKSALQVAIDNGDHEGATCIVSELYDYAPTEVLDVIRQAFEQDLVDETVLGLDEIEESIAAGDEHFLRHLNDCPPTGIEDTVEELRNWYWPGNDSDEDFDEDYDDELWDLDDNIGSSPDVKPSFSWPTANLLSPVAQPDPYYIPAPIRNEGPRVGRNDPCPCGSGKKFKKCCGTH